VHSPGDVPMWHNTECGPGCLVDRACNRPVEQADFPVRPGVCWFTEGSWDVVQPAEAAHQTEAVSSYGGRS
jgi:hypothetical protein